MPKSRLRVKLPLYFVLIVPFVAQIFAAVGLVGWLSFRNGQNAIAALARELQREIEQRIEARLDTYARTPATLNQMNTELARIGWLNLDDLRETQRRFLQQLRELPEITYISWGNERGELTGAFRDREGNLGLTLADASTDSAIVTFRSDREGNIGEELTRSGDYDPRIRPWYRAAVEAGGAAWTSPYPWRDNKLGIDLNAAFYEDENNQELKGVFAVSFTLDAISQFLEELEIGKSGQAFIIERSGQIIGTSIPEVLAVSNGDELAPVLAVDSANPAICETVGYLQAKFGSLDRIQERHWETIAIAGKRHFLQVAAFQDDAGLDWLVAVLIPEADFMAEIAANTRTTILLCGLALALSTLFGFVISRRIAKPIAWLDLASREIAEGKWERQIAPSKINELDSLTTAFNQMSRTLKQSRDRLREYSHSLEAKVSDRTRDLKTSEERFHLVNQSVNDGIWDRRIDRDELYYSPQWKRMLGYGEEELPNTISTWERLIHPDDREAALQAERTHLAAKTAIFRNEFRMRHKNGSYRWILSRAKVVERNDLGAPLRIVGSHTDISDRKAAELALQASEARNRAILMAIPDQILRMSAEGVYLDLIRSQDFPSTLPDGINPIGKQIIELLPTEAEQLLKAAQNALATQALQIYEQKVWLDIQKRWRYEEIRVVPCGGNEVLAIARDISDKRKAELTLRAEQQKSERLLLNILPRSIAERLKEIEGAIAEHYDSVGILFADIVNFTSLSAQMSPTALVELLDSIFSAFDRLAEVHGLEKIKTIGDAYMVAGGLPEPHPDSLAAIAEMALAMNRAIPTFRTEKLTRLQSDRPLQIRIGIATGAVVAGTIGKKKLSYDLWGDTVNVSARMESTGEPGKIQVTREVYEGLRDRYEFEERGRIFVKGKGEMQTYWLLKKKNHIQSS